MKAALVVDTEKVEIQDVPEPELKDEDVLIKVKVCRGLRFRPAFVQRYACLSQATSSSWP